MASLSDGRACAQFEPEVVEATKWAGDPEVWQRIMAVHRCCFYRLSAGPMRVSAADSSWRLVGGLAINDF